MNESTKQKLSYAAAMGVAALAIPMSAKAAIVINEVYSAGGSSSTLAAFKTDFIELFNNGTSAVDVSGYTLQYAPSTRATGVFDVAIGSIPSGTSIPAGGFYLVQTGTSGTGGLNDVTPDLDFNTGASLSNTSGSVRLVVDPLATTVSVVDLLGWGALTNANFEGNPETQPASVAVSMTRTAGLDTGDNQTDFTQTVPTPTPGNVPEPTSLALTAAAAIMLGRRRK